MAGLTHFAELTGSKLLSAYINNTQYTFDPPGKIKTSYAFRGVKREYWEEMGEGKVIGKNQLIITFLSTNLMKFKLFKSHSFLLCVWKDGLLD